MKRRRYKVVTICKNEVDEDLCGTFLSMLCLITSKVWGKFEVISIERVDFYE